MNSSYILFNGDIVSPSNKRTHGWIHVTDGKIAAIGDGPPRAGLKGRRLDVQGRILLPGFIDLHVHGASGHEAMNGTRESLSAMAKIYAQHGVTSFLPTTWTASPATTRRALETIAASVGPQPQGATILGAHLEGPYLNPNKCGAQQVEHIRRADPVEATKLLDLNVIRLVSLAPEYPENEWLIRECVRRGVTVSAAHTNATFDETCSAVKLGLRQTTHTFNAMSPLHQREPGVVGAALMLKEIQCELIADNLHVHPAVMGLLHRIKGLRGVILISDAVSAAGLADGDHVVDGRTVTVKDGAVRLHDGTLAGSTLMMDRALSNYRMATGETIERLWVASSLNAARAIGVHRRKGSLVVGKDADIVAIDENINVCLTMAEGRIVYNQGTK